MQCKSKEVRTSFKTQRNLCVTLLRKAKRDYYESLDLGKVIDFEKFWNTLKSVFGHKVTSSSEIKLSKTFKKYFVDIVSKLGIETVVSSISNVLETGNLLSSKNTKVTRV